MGKVKNENYITIQGWMVNELGLKGNELLVYAIIYGFTQEDNQWFSGSVQYLSDWLNCSRQTVFNALKALCDKGLIYKEDRIKNGVKFCYYRSKNFTREVKNFDGGEVKNFDGGGQKFLPNNIEDNTSFDKIDDNIDICKSRSSCKKSEHNIETNIVDEFNSICMSFPKVQKLTDSRRKAIKARLKDDGYDQIIEAFKMAEESDFLSGRSGKWQATFDWIMKPSNFAKIIEGNYASKEKKKETKLLISVTGAKVDPDEGYYLDEEGYAHDKFGNIVY